MRTAVLEVTADARQGADHAIPAGSHWQWLGWPAMIAATTPRTRLDQAAELATGVSMSVADDVDLMDPQLLRRSLEARLAGAAGRVRIAGTLDRRLTFIERLDGRWVVVDLSGIPHRGRDWPQWATGHVQVDDPGSWLSLATLDDHAVYRLSRPDVQLVALYHPENFPLPRFPLGISDVARAARSTLLAISAYARARHSAATPVAARLAPAGRRSPVEEDTVVIGPDFTLAVPTVEYGNPEIISFTLPNPRTGQLLDLPWDVFGFGVERLIRQIKNMGTRLNADLCFGINEAGLVIATFLSSAQFNRCPIGYLKCIRVRDELHLDEASLYPQAGPAPVIVVCDFEVKHADVVGFIARNLRARYPGAELHFAVFGAMTKSAELKVGSFSDLTGAEIMHGAGFASIFIAATMSPPGIEPPLELR